MGSRNECNDSGCFGNRKRKKNIWHMQHKTWYPIPIFALILSAMTYLSVAGTPHIEVTYV